MSDPHLQMLVTMNSVLAAIRQAAVAEYKAASDPAVERICLTIKEVMTRTIERINE